MDCFGTYFTHAQCCDNVRVQSATGWTASLHSLHVPKTVIKFVFKVLRNGLRRYILYTLCKNVRFRVSALSRFRAFEFACFRAITGSVLPFSRFRVFGFLRFRRFRVFGFSCFRKLSPPGRLGFILSGIMVTFLLAFSDSVTSFRLVRSRRKAPSVDFRHTS